MKGFRNSPYGERRIGAVTAIKARAPVLGGNFGVWGGLFSTFDCAVKGIRKKEDPYNASMSSLSLTLDFGFGGVDRLIGGNGGLNPKDLHGDGSIEVVFWGLCVRDSIGSLTLT